MDIEKLIQTVSYLLKKNSDRMNYTKLIKILYLADKESYKAINSSITGDVYYLLDNVRPFFYKMEIMGKL